MNPVAAYFMCLFCIFLGIVIGDFHATEKSEKHSDKNVI